MNLKALSSTQLIVLVSVFIMLFGNMAFVSNVLQSYPLAANNIFFLLSVFVVFSCFIILLFSLLCFKRTLKPVLILVLLVSSSAAYFMDTYNVVIDDSMIDNIVKTDMAESLDLLSFKLFIYILLLGVLPASFVYKVTITGTTLKQDIVSRLKLIAVSVFVIAALVWLFSSYYASFFREHKVLRFYSNPVYYIYSAGKYANSFFKSGSVAVRSIGQDATIPASDQHRELVILVLGETARADRFELNGYERPTNPLLKKESVISFTNVWACGTSTATSVPCMFALHGAAEHSRDRASSTENVLDVIKRAGVNVLWLDNNSSSKGVADRVMHESYKTAEHNPVCDVECRDEGMLSHLQEYIEQHPSGDIFIVLHQMGNHGPAYYKRYPESFEKFTPVCKTNQLESCSDQEINNAYDNAILYTDYFLSKTIALLKNNQQQFEAAMVYISDHGESLGESGLYLHGLPNLFAPDEQRHVPMILWFSESFDHNEINYDRLNASKNTKYSHDNLFHTILGLMEVKSASYNESMDIIEHKGED